MFGQRLKNTFEASLLRSSAIGGIIFGSLGLLPTSVQAQDGPVTKSAAADKSSSGSSASGDIIVTALKRSESLQKTPAAVSIIGSAEIQSRQLTNVSAIASFAPSVRTNYENTAAQFFIRGVGQQDDLAGAPQAVAFIQDGIVIPSRVSGVGLFDVQNIQILPGPQGTLYGSSAIGGVIQVTSSRPTHRSEGSILVEGGNYDTAHLTAIGNTPITRDWSIRFAYDGLYHKGYMSNGTFNDRRTSFRLSSLYEPAGTDFSLLLRASYTMDRVRSQPSVPYPFLTSDPYKVPQFDPDTAFFYPPSGVDNSIGRLNVNVFTVSGTATWKVGDIDLSYTSGYVNMRQPGVNQAITAGLLVPQTYGINLFSNEFRASSSPGTRLSWLAGLFQQYNGIQESFLFGPNFSGLDDTTKYRTYAAFGQATFAVTGRTRVTGGLRYSSDTVSTKDAILVFPTFPGFGRGELPFSFSKTYRRLNWKVGVEQDVGARSMFYAAVQSGSNPGTYNGNTPSPETPIKPQTMIGYTVGIKNKLFGSLLQLNLESYLYEYKNQIITTDDQAIGLHLVLNAERSRSYGFQADAILRPTPTTNIHANVGYLNAKFSRFVVPLSTGSIDYSGARLAFSPSWTASVGAEQTINLGADDETLSLRIDSYLSTKFNPIFSVPAGFSQGAFSRTDASITYRAPGGHWELGIWAKNLEDNAIIATGGLSTGRSYPGVVYLEPPRTFGARLLLKFN